MLFTFFTQNDDINTSGKVDIYKIEQNAFKDTKLLLKDTKNIYI